MDAFDIVVVGGGTAGCVLASRLSEDPARSVCLLEAGPDHGPRAGGGWPPELVSAHELAYSHDWGTGGEDGRSLGARVIGGCSAHNACMVIAGTAADYDEWGPGWDAVSMRPYLQRARAGLAPQAANTRQPAPVHEAFMAAAVAAGFALLDDLDDPARPVGIGPYASNVDDATRLSTAFAYLDAARARPNLTVEGDTLVDRVTFAGEVASGVMTADGRAVAAGLVVLAAGAYFTPALLLRSGIGPEEQLRGLGIPIVVPLPVGERLLDHCGTGLAFEPSEALHAATEAHAGGGPLFESHAILKARSSGCPPDTFDLHLLPWTNRTEVPGRCTATVGTFLVKPRSHGSVRLRSADPADLPIVKRGFLSDERDLPPLVEAIELTRRITAQAPLAGALRGELRPGAVDLEAYVRETVRSYFHPAGTCPIGDVLDRSCRVHGVERLVVADASVMPTIPRANTNLTTAAIAERVAETLAAG